MRMVFVGVVIVLAAVIVEPVLSQANVRILRTGVYLIEPPRFLPDERWFGLLTGNPDGWTLRRVSPRAVSVKAICGDQAAEISADVDGVLFLVNGVRGLSEGSIVTTIPAPRVLYPGEWVDISIRRGDGYALEALGRAIREDGDTILTDYQFWVRRGQQAQMIASFERNGLDNPRQVVWSGDLDRDLQPDILFDLPLGDVGSNYVLFLSSLRVAEQLVARVADFSTPGC